MAIDKTYNNPGNSKGFHKGTRPDRFGPDSNDGEKNRVSGVSEANKTNGTYDESNKRPKDPSLGAVPMPNKIKPDVNKGILNFGSDYPTNISGVMKPNKIS